MPSYQSLQSAEISKLLDEHRAEYETLKAQKLSLDMTRGKPCTEQLDLCDGLLSLPGKGNRKTPSGTDTGNYGGLEGLTEVRALFAQYMDVDAKEILVGGNSSLNLMHDTLMRAMIYGLPDGDAPWSRQSSIKFLCPSPGYDRHFALCEHLGIEMIVVPMHEAGPDMDFVEKAVASDQAIRGIWCVPRYSNPTGIVYSDDTVRRLAAMKTAAPDFRILWDDAYAVHHLGAGPAPLLHILREARAAGNPNRPILFASTSKISYAGAGLAMMAASKQNIQDVLKHTFFQTIGPDKINQLRHLLFFKNIDGIKAHMDKHAAILKPKFEAVEEGLQKGFGDSDIAIWTKPAGGYFVSLDLMDGCASRTGALARDVGVIFTKAGATYPYGKDPRDRNIRIAPTLPSVTQIETAIQVLALCARIAALESMKEKN